jgi:hypothetical protein
LEDGEGEIKGGELRSSSAGGEGKGGETGGDRAKELRWSVIAGAAGRGEAVGDRLDEEAGAVAPGGGGCGKLGAAETVRQRRLARDRGIRRERVTQQKDGWDRQRRT